MIFNVYIYTYTCIIIYSALSQLASRWQYLIALAADVDVDRGKSTNQTGLKSRNKSAVPDNLSVLINDAARVVKMRGVL